MFVKRKILSIKKFFANVIRYIL